MRKSAPLFRRCPHRGKIVGIDFSALVARLLFPLAGFTALVWLAVRLLPKPSRAAYPCMKAALPVASSFLVWLAGLSASAFALNAAQRKLRQRRAWGAAVVTLSALMVFSSTFLATPQRDLRGAVDAVVPDPLGPNNPIGKAKGIFPGRVVWAWNPDATNENCVPNKWGDGYFLDKNCNQNVVDAMLADALQQLTGAASEQDAWEAVFRYFNRTHGKGDVGYADGETIFIKVNAVHAWTTNKDGSIRNDDGYGNVDTSPQAILAMLRQLVYKAGVPQENIYIGDPYTHLFKHCLEKWRADFPRAHYLDKSGLNGCEKYTADPKPAMYFSDKGTVLKTTTDSYFTAMENADYLLNIPAMKGHRWGGVTFFGKNFFGANTRSGADHMHAGLHRQDYNLPLRSDYGMYRVFVDLLGHEKLGGKSLLYFMDALWACSYEHEPPVKFKSAPFNNDWTSSILLSLDPLAIESVCLDILQAEFPKTESEVPGRYWYANFPAVDDYLHQAADSRYWPKDIVYDPESDGTPLGSLGVHEHWNNPVDQQYSRNLGAGSGIELIKRLPSAGVSQSVTLPNSPVLLANCPNPFNAATTLVFELPSPATVRLEIYAPSGKRVAQLLHEHRNAGSHRVFWDASAMPSGVYFVKLAVEEQSVDNIRPVLLVK